MTGEYFMDKAGITNEKISVLSLRLIDSAGQEKPVQVDEKDNTGLFLETVTVSSTRTTRLFSR